jgi:hypothetical protein
MSCKKYRPSNGTEGESFIYDHCHACIHGKYEHTGDIDDKPCDILSRSFFLNVDDREYPEEWTYDEHGKPTCTAWRKWDWGRDDDGNWNNPPEPPTDDPNQLCMPFIFDEIGVPKKEEKKHVNHAAICP